MFLSAARRILRTMSRLGASSFISIFSRDDVFFSVVGLWTAIFSCRGTFGSNLILIGGSFNRGNALFPILCCDRRFVCEDVDESPLCLRTEIFSWHRTSGSTLIFIGGKMLCVRSVSVDADVAAVNLRIYEMLLS